MEALEEKSFDTMPNLHLSNWLFHFNPYDNMWYAFTREDHTSYFNDGDCFFIKSKHVSVLMEMLRLANGDKTKVRDVIY